MALKKDSLQRLPNTSVHCFVGTEKHLDADKTLSNNDDNFSEKFGSVEKFITNITNDANLQLQKSLKKSLE